ncbi:MAG: hypothetical protein ACTHOU_18760 [Aureliella sp.]
MSDTQQKRDAIDALLALGHKKGEAVRMVEAAIARGAPLDNVRDLLREAYRKPATAGASDRSAYGAEFAEYYRGSVTLGGSQSDLLQVARAVGPGMSQSEFGELAKQVEQLRAKRDQMGNKAYQAALWALPEKVASDRKAPIQFQPVRDPKGKPVESGEPVLGAGPIKNLGQSEFKIGDSVTAPGKAGDLVAGVITGILDTGKIGVETHEGYWPRRPEQLEHYRPAFNPGDKVHMPRYASDAGGLGSITAKNPDGTYEVLLKGRAMTVRPGDVQSPEGLAATPREPSPAIAALGGASESAPTVNVNQAIHAMLNQPANDADSGTFTTTLDKAQMIADAVGVVDQTGVTDLANAGVSLTRAFTEPKRAAEHLKDAGMRAISAIPIVGDAAKVAKYGAKGFRTAAGGADAAKALQKQGAQPAGTAAGKAQFGSGVNAAAQAALQLIAPGPGGGGGGAGGGGTGGAPPGGGTGGGAGGGGAANIGPAAQQGASGLNSFSAAIQRFLNGLGAGGMALAAIGNQVWQKALKPVIDWMQQMQDRTQKMLDGQRQLGQYNGDIANSFTQLESQRVFRAISASQAMAGSTRRLADAQNRLEQGKEDLTRPWTMLGTEIQTLRTELVATIYRGINQVDIVGALIEKFLNDKETEDKARNATEFSSREARHRIKERKL